MGGTSPQPADRCVWGTPAPAFAALFDFSFTTFITLKFLRVIYTVLTVLILLVGGVLFLASLFRGGALGVFVAIVVVPAVTLLYLVFARITLEAIALFFRIGENTSAMAASLAGANPTTGEAADGLTGVGGPFGSPTTPLPGSAVQ